MKRKTAHCRPTAVLALIAISAFCAQAYELPLSPESIRQAYFLGRHTSQARDFLGRYEKSFPSSASPEVNIAKIQILTPYAQIVSAAYLDMLNDTAVDADWNYQNRAIPFIVRVWIYCPSASEFSSAPFDRFSELVHETSIIVSQSERLVPTGTSHSTLYTGDDARWANGLEVELRFTAAQFSPAPVRVAISSPGGQHAEATFDLANLK